MAIPEGQAEQWLRREFAITKKLAPLGALKIFNGTFHSAPISKSSLIAFLNSEE